MRYLYCKKVLITIVVAFFIFLWLIYITKRVSPSTDSKVIENVNDFDKFDIVDRKFDNDSLVNRLLSVDKVNLNMLKVIGPDLYGYNIIVAHELPLLREIPDTRPLECLDIEYDIDDMTPVSVIIPVYNEGYSVLMRTVYTIFHRSPEHLITEVILVDDFSPYHDSKVALTKLQTKFSKVVVHRLPSRSGLIKAKIEGEKIARSKILVFLDSHTEVNIGWLPPLVREIMKNPGTKVVVPIIDTIDADTFEYQRNPVTIGGFNWGLYFTWLPRHKIDDNVITPVRTPTLSGGYFAMTKTMYRYFGGYDPEMKSWGAENLEMSFRVWQCGGEINLIPCSRVGHIFRSRRPYGEIDAGNKWLWNTLRMATVWMDEYVEKFYAIRPEARSAEFGDVSKRRDIRDSLQCNSFRWYLENLLPEML